VLRREGKPVLLPLVTLILGTVQLKRFRSVVCWLGGEILLKSRNVE
jgi:hypothetical protein